MGFKGSDTQNRVIGHQNLLVKIIFKLKVYDNVKEREKTKEELLKNMNKTHKNKQHTFIISNLHCQCIC